MTIPSPNHRCFLFALLKIRLTSPSRLNIQISLELLVIGTMRKAKVLIPFEKGIEETYWLAYLNVQNQNFPNTPALTRIAHVITNGSNAARMYNKHREISFVSGVLSFSSLKKRYIPPNAINIAPCCFIKKPIPSSSPPANSIQSLFRSLA